MERITYLWRRDGRIVRSDKTFLSQEKLEDVIQQIVSGTNRYVNELSPIVDARLEDGSRVNVVLKPVALNGPIMTIRKFPKEKVTMKQLVNGRVHRRGGRIFKDACQSQI